MSNAKVNLMCGALVQWTGGEGYGVITEIGSRIIVRWDDSMDNPTQFATTEVLERIDLNGKVAQRRSSGEIASVMGPASGTTPTWRCQVILANGGVVTTNVPEEDLRPMPVTDPVERFQSGEIGSLQKYRLQEVTRWYRVQHLHNDLVSLGQAQVDIKPHQVSVVHKVISNYPHRFLLCDEVGLGKTIEAGMILKELRAREPDLRVLAIVPPNLIGQWQFEMKSKFNESFAVLNTQTVRHLSNQGYIGNPFAHPDYSDSVLCSSSWVARDEIAQLCAEVDWDLVIIDEAHHARSHPDGSTTRLYRLVRDLSPAEQMLRRGMLFLTATPMQLNTHELYSLVEVLDPALFASPEDFERHRQEMPNLSKLVEELHQYGFPLPNQNPHDTAGLVAEWLDIDPAEAYDRLSTSLEETTEELAGKHRLSEILIRNRKAVVGGFMPRSAYRWEVELTPSERTALQAVEAYVQYGYQLAEGGNNNAIGFVMVIFQKLMASSIAAIKESLGRRRDKVLAAASTSGGQSFDDHQDRLDNDDNAGDVVGSADVGDTGLADRELQLLDHAIESLANVEYDSKAQVLIDRLAELLHERPDEKVIVFTQFRETQRHLAELISAQGWGVNQFHGQLSPLEKDSAIVRFRDGTGPQVLVSTEAGGEGRNLQFCHLLVNYDLPWNPMRVEQRIGRVDRIGQEQAISIFNLWVKDTIEARVLDVLEHRIRVFEETVGGLDPILGEAENDLEKIMRAAEAQRAAALDDFGNRIEAEIRNAREAGDLLVDFIMDTKSFRREIAERIIGQPSPIDADDFERFIGQLLSDVRTHIKRADEGYELTFHGRFYDDNRRQLFPMGSKMQAVFRPDARPDAQDVEFMAFGHKVIDAIVSQVLDEKYEGAIGTRRLYADSELQPTDGWLFTYQFTVSGIRPEERIVPVFVSDNGEIDLDIGRIIVQRAFRFDKDEENINPDEIPNNLDDAHLLAEQFASEKSEQMQRQVQNQADDRTSREVDRLEAMFDYRERVANDKMVATQATLEQLRANDDEVQRRILPVWEANLRRAQEVIDNLAEERERRIDEVEQYRYPQVDWALKSLGRIEVVQRIKFDAC